MEYPSCQHIEQYLVPGKRCHLVGIGGVSMRPLGLVLRRMGMEISGSDMNASVSTDELISRAFKFPSVTGPRILKELTASSARPQRTMTTPKSPLPAPRASPF